MNRMVQKNIRRLLSGILALGVLAALAQPGFAEEPPEATLTLAGLVEEALESNPEILAARDRWKAATARIPQVSALPDPWVKFRLRNAGTDLLAVGDDPMSNAGLTFSQAFPFPGKLPLKGQMAGKEAEREEQIYLSKQLSVVSRLKVAYYHLYLAHTSIEIVEKDKDLLERFEKAAEALYSVGKGIQQDVLKAQVEISMLIDRLTMLNQRREVFEARINALLDRPPHAPLGKPEEVAPDELPFGLDELNEMALENCPQLTAADRIVERNSFSLDLAKREYYPDLNLSLGYSSREGAFEELWDVQLGVEIPLYYWKKQRKGVEEAESRLGQSRQNREAVKEAVLLKLKEQHVTAETARRLMTLYETGIIPQATLSLESAISGYEVGKVDFLTLLNNLITLLNYELVYQEELVNFQSALARMEEIVAVPLAGQN